MIQFCALYREKHLSEKNTNRGGGILVFQGEFLVMLEITGNHTDTDNHAHLSEWVSEWAVS